MPSRLSPPTPTAAGAGPVTPPTPPTPTPQPMDPATDARLASMINAAVTLYQRYHQALITAGIDSTTADRLASDFHNALWTSTFSTPGPLRFLLR